MTETLRASIDVDAVRARFSSLRDFAFLDAPGGAQVPDEVGEAGHPPRDLHTTARVTLAQVGSRFNIIRIELRTVGDVPGVDQDSFQDLAEQAKDCTVPRALTGTEITLEASIAGS